MQTAMWMKFAPVLLASVVVTTMVACAPPNGGKGSIVGGISPCEGVFIPGGPQFAAGTVTVMRGQVRWQSVGNGNSQAVFPSDIVGTQTVGTNQVFQFQLDPGTYVVRAKYVGGNVQPYTTVEVRAGVTARADIPNECM